MGLRIHTSLGCMVRPCRSKYHNEVWGERRPLYSAALTPGSPISLDRKLPGHPILASQHKCEVTDGPRKNTHSSPCGRGDCSSSAAWSPPYSILAKTTVR